MRPALIVALVLCALPLFAEAPPKTAAPPSDPAAELLGEVLRDNARFAATHGKAFFAPFRDDQHPRATVVMCADSRVQTRALEDVPDGDLFVVRNIGNQLDLNGGSVDYGIQHLKTPLLLVVGHVRCGAVKAAMGDYGDEPPSVRRELDGLHTSLARTAATGSADERWLQNVIGNVHQQVDDALREYRDQVNAGRLTVVGAVYDFRDDLGQGAGRLVLVNVNGERDAAKIAQNPVIKRARELQQRAK